MPTLILNSKQIHFKRVFVIAIVLVLSAASFLWAIKYSSLKTELKKTQEAVKSQQINEKTLNFTSLFIDKVLKAKEEIDFETRLKLENAVRDLKDEEILTQWNKFIESGTEEEAQKEVKNLLEMLVGKIEVQ